MQKLKPLRAEQFSDSLAGIFEKLLTLVSD